ncbi:FAD-dependent pyridine nucleotide-disulfide oxidoreductase [Deinococcus proteolyticus MRP]|uniref:FAD-dependent pyridine nucleotide-disulfide oxidoreductase n=1 Tax=Deinococcus proteolyticus (strain ATCC 35074 / DSM 20540 / JCM 6276 / NBRC 101906 / NCIMB 13154 / VKM Ac-1939 / CCM 2703 / MRP) TaxID=693977 RepID=F0RK81_DEIPM|nr:FAD-dependent monooxygenase [Deinococcus proteolyticus]ADY25640.1 FAD-dependent pyridine nucleotide-disulfide oxidoreductase [Deinococcus proteolyticus MRP]
MQLQHQNIVIIGAGVSGLALAGALHRHGAHCQVYEAEDQLWSLGGGLIIPPNSVKVLERLGLDSVLKVRGVELQEMRIYDASGRLLYARSQQDVAGQHGHALLGLAREDLHRALAEYLPAGTVQTGHRLTGLENHFHEAVARFHNGRQVRADLLVAADGRNSRVRELLYPETRLVPTGDVAYRGVTSQRPAGDLDSTFSEFWGPGRRFTCFRMAENLTYWHAPVRQSLGAPALSKAELLRAFEDFPPAVLDLIAATDQAEITALPIQDISPLPEWWSRRTVLIGDAAHATSPNLGQGAAQALADAEALATWLVTAPDRLTALESYQQQREGTANAATATARAFGEMGQARGVMRFARNLALSINPELARRRIEAFYGDPVS